MGNTTLRYELELKDNKLIVHHSEITDTAIYDVCDVDGKILITGFLENQSSFTEIELNEIAKRNYQFFIVEEGNIFKTSFSYN